jgi:Activator of Hsp90 ATPase homolog 1-like protein
MLFVRNLSYNQTTRMGEQFRAKQFNGIHDEVLQEKTGKNWDQWFVVLDKAGARMMDHQEITAWLRDRSDMPRWWRQLVAIGYEREHGMRAEPRQKSVRRGKNLAAPLPVVWAAWHDPAVRDRWLPGAKFEIDRSTPNQAMHLQWPDGTKVNVDFSESNGRTKIVVIHNKLSDESAVERTQAYWSEALERLKTVLEA